MSTNTHPVLRCILFALLLPAASIIAGVSQIFFSSRLAWIAAAIGVAVVAICYVVFRKKLLPCVSRMNAVIAAFFILVFTALMIIAKGNVSGGLLFTATTILGLLLPGVFSFTFLRPSPELVWLFVIGAALVAFWLSVALQPKFRGSGKLVLAVTLAAALLLGLDGFLYSRRPEARYAGHGFDYMNGWSSTDFSDYMVYSEPSKLATLDHPASFVIENEAEMPVLDGAEACYPLYAALAKAVYKDIDVIEREFMEESMRDGGWVYFNGKIVTFTNTITAFDRLIYNYVVDGQLDEGMREFDVDMVFGARPSKGQMADASDAGVDVRVTPIGREAFVFFVEPDNPVTNLSADEIRRIYSGEITNWAEVGGKNEKILAFQRPENSGSQTMMQYFMGDTPLKKPETYETVGPMEGIVKNVAQYNNERGALGYSFRYFVEDLSQENDVRVLSVDGVQPTLENIENGSYPLTVDLCVITRENEQNENVQKMIDYCLSDEGQEIIRKTGYGRK